MGPCLIHKELFYLLQRIMKKHLETERDLAIETESETHADIHPGLTDSGCKGWFILHGEPSLSSETQSESLSVALRAHPILKTKQKNNVNNGDGLRRQGL